MDRYQQKHLTHPEAEALCAEWQRILRLQDWDILVKVVRGNGLNLPPESQGRCLWTLERKEATIKLRRV